MKQCMSVIVILLCVTIRLFAQDSLNVRRVGFCDMPCCPWDVAVAGSYVYVADIARGLRIVDITNPSFPTEVGFYNSGASYGVAVLGNYAYVTDYYMGLRVVNITNPAATSEVGFYDTPGYAWGVAVAGNYAFVADGYSGLHVVNITNPSNPVQAGWCDTPGYAAGVAVAGNHAYVGDQFSGLRVVNIANPSAPVEVGFYDAGYALNVAVSGDYAYVAGGSSLRVVCISDPVAPVEVGYVPGGAGDVAVAGNYAYIAGGSSGLRVIDVTNPAAPLEVGFYDIEDARGVAVLGHYACVADFDGGVGIYDCSRATGNLTLIAPVGGEQWRVFQSDTVRWSGYGVTTPIKIELNRHYPQNAWDVLAEETPNDGMEAFFISDPLSDTCRIRISAVGDVYCDSSDTNFSIVSSQGYLALVLQAQPSIPVLSWNASTHECPETVALTYKLKNFGSESVVVFAPALISGAQFNLTHNCPAFFALAPGQMSTYGVTLTYNPQAEGSHRDTLRMQTDAVNAVGGYVRIPLVGTQIRTPATPQVVITTQGSDAVLHWNPVTQSIGGCPVTVTEYLVFFSEVSNGPFWYHGHTTDTVYTHSGAVAHTTHMYYHVITSTAPPAFFASLPNPNSGRRVLESEVLDILHRASAMVEQR